MEIEHGAWTWTMDHEPRTTDHIWNMEYDHAVGTRTMDHGAHSMEHTPWSMEHGPQTMDHGQWTIHGPWIMDSGLSMDHGHGLWTTHGPWTMDHGACTVVCRPRNLEYGTGTTTKERGAVYSWSVEHNHGAGARRMEQGVQHMEHGTMERGAWTRS